MCMDINDDSSILQAILQRHVLLSLAPYLNGNVLG